MPDKIAHHPDEKHIIRFNESRHTYVDNFNCSYVSGTTLIGKFFPKFDSFKVATMCSKGKNPKYSGRTPQDIMSEWSAEAHRGSSEGDNVHLYSEMKMKNVSPESLPLPLSDRCVLLFKHIDKITAWIKKKYDFIDAEMIVFSPKLKIAGTIDLIMEDKNTGEILILDWKQNKEITFENKYQTAHSPISHLPDTHISKYSLQLSLYQNILEREGYFPYATGYRRALLHLTPNGVKPIRLEDYTYEIKEILKAA